MSRLVPLSVGMVIFVSLGLLLALSRRADDTVAHQKVVAYSRDRVIGASAPNPVPGDLGRLGPAAPLAFKSLRRVTNQWNAGNRGQRDTLYVVVAAGAAKGRPGSGRFEIVRTYLPGDQTFSSVDVPGAGKVKIVGAPLGVEGREDARFARLRFVTSKGDFGVLNLRDDSVDLERHIDKEGGRR